MSATRLRNVQLGIDGLATNNFILGVPDVQDGTLSLKRGNLGSPSQNILRVDANGVIYHDQPLVRGNERMTFHNRIDNGDMAINQTAQGAITTSGIYLADRWLFGTNSTRITATQTVTNRHPEFLSSLLFTTTTTATPAAGDFCTLGQQIEGMRVADLMWGTASAKSVTVSFRVRASIAGIYSVSIRNNGNTRSCVRDYTVTAANTWQTVAVTFPGDTGGTYAIDTTTAAMVHFSVYSGSTFRTSTLGSWQASNYISSTSSIDLCVTNGATFQITGAQLEVGTAATAYDYIPQQFALQQCQRHFQIIPGSFFDSVWANTTAIRFKAPYQIQMRASPTVTIPATTFTIEDWSQVAYSCTGMSLAVTRLDSKYVDFALNGVVATPTPPSTVVSKPGLLLTNVFLDARL